MTLSQDGIVALYEMPVVLWGKKNTCIFAYCLEPLYGMDKIDCVKVDAAKGIPSIADMTARRNQRKLAGLFRYLIGFLWSASVAVVLLSIASCHVVQERFSISWLDRIVRLR